MSDKARIADNKPLVQEFDAGTYYWCACGRSQKQPFCDGSHSGTVFTPKEYTLDEKKRVAICTCKQSANPPFCDGSHKGLTPDT